MKHCILFFFMCLMSLLSAQNISVSSFKLDPSDLTANLEGTTVYDQNGNKCALIRIQTTQKGFSFDVGSLGVQKVDDNKVGEIWLYVPGGVKRITMRHPQLGTLEKWPFPVNILGSKTYMMYITTTEVQTIVSNAVTQQYVVFRVNPPEALVEFDGDIIDINDGVGGKRKAFGTYDYTVQAKLYHPQTGQVTVNDPDNKHEVKIDLLPAFGYIEVPAKGNLGGAKVFIDNEYKGTVPFRSERLASGDHQVRLVQQMYSPVMQAVSVKDGETTRFTPALSADFAKVTLRVEGNAEIWVNEERKGTGTWTGELVSGDYKIECKLPNHLTATKELTISPLLQGQTIVLPQPMPFYGTLDINSVPMDADIYLDGKKIGTTPMQLSKCSIGQHTIRIAKVGHSDFTKTFTLTENATEEITAQLERSISMNDNYYNHNNEADINNSQEMGNDEISPNNSFIETLTFSVKGISFSMVLIKGSTFQMGNNEGDRDEIPVHQVTLSDYHIGQTEVTQELWEAVMEENPSYQKGANKPVNNVSWNDCQLFIRKLNKLTGNRFRLPTEAEWEFAASGGIYSQGTKYSGGNNINDFAWYKQNSNNLIQQVATKSANEIGLYDMCGNVYEWCEDYYGRYNSSVITNNRVLRGGSFASEDVNCRVSYRFSYAPSRSGLSFGMRLAL